MNKTISFLQFGLQMDLAWRFGAAMIFSSNSWHGPTVDEHATWEDDRISSVLLSHLGHLPTEPKRLLPAQIPPLPVLSVRHLCTEIPKQLSELWLHRGKKNKKCSLHKWNIYSTYRWNIECKINILHGTWDIPRALPHKSTACNVCENKQVWITYYNTCEGICNRGHLYPGKIKNHWRAWLNLHW